MSNCNHNHIIIKDHGFTCRTCKCRITNMAKNRPHTVYGRISDYFMDINAEFGECITVYDE